MSLPSGYRKLEYIQSSGTQYIDLGVKPNQGYAIEIKAKCSATSKQTFGGCDTRWKSNGFMLAVAGFEFGNNANTSLQNHGSEPITLKLSADGGYKNGTKTWDTSAIPAFQATANFTLCALNRSGTLQEYLSGNIYYCKVWDDSGTLIRDCIPCKSTSGVVGLWDDVNSVFYQNAGTGTFTSGPEVKGTNKTLIGGTGYDLKGGSPLINGTKYSLKKGRALIDGTGYDISIGKKFTITFANHAQFKVLGFDEFADTIEIPEGDSITLRMYAYNGSEEYRWVIYLNGIRIGSVKTDTKEWLGGSSRQYGDYRYTPQSDCTLKGNPTAFSDGGQFDITTQ